MCRGSFWDGFFLGLFTLSSSECIISAQRRGRARPGSVANRTVMLQLQFMQRDTWQDQKISFGEKSLLLSLEELIILVLMHLCSSWFCSFTSFISGNVNPFTHSGHYSGQLFKQLFSYIYIHGFWWHSCISATTVDASESFHTLPLYLQ